MLSTDLSKALCKGPQPLEKFCSSFKDSAEQEPATCNPWINVLGWIHFPNLRSVADISLTLERRWNHFKDRTKWHEQRGGNERPHPLTESALFQYIARHHFPESLTKASMLNKNEPIRQLVSRLANDKEESFRLLCRMFGPETGKIALTVKQWANLQIMLMRYAGVVEKDSAGKLRRLTYLDLLREWVGTEPARHHLFKEMESHFRLTEYQKWTESEKYTPSQSSPVRSNERQMDDVKRVVFSRPPLDAVPPPQENGNGPEPKQEIINFDPYPNGLSRVMRKPTVEESFHYFLLKRTEQALGRFQVKLSDAAIAKLIELFCNSPTDTLRQDVFYFLEAAEGLFHPLIKSENNPEEPMPMQEKWELVGKTLDRLFLPQHGEVLSILEGAYLHTACMELLTLKKYEPPPGWPLEFFECLTCLSREERKEIWIKLAPLFKHQDVIYKLGESSSAFCHMLYGTKRFNSYQLAYIFVDLLPRDFNVANIHGKTIDPALLLPFPRGANNIEVFHHNLETVNFIERFIGSPLPADMAFGLLIDAPVTLKANDKLSSLMALRALKDKCGAPLLDHQIIEKHAAAEEETEALLNENVMSGMVRTKRSDLKRVVLQSTFMDIDCRLPLLAFPGLHQDCLKGTKHWSSIISLSPEFGKGFLIQCAWVPLHIHHKYPLINVEGVYWVFELTFILWGRTHTIRIPLQIPESSFQNNLQLSQLFQHLVRAFGKENYGMPQVLTLQTYPRDPTERALEVLSRIRDIDALNAFNGFCKGATEARHLALEIFRFLWDLHCKVRSSGTRLCERNRILNIFGLKNKHNADEEFIREGHLYALASTRGFSLFPQDHRLHADPIYSFKFEEYAEHIQNILLLTDTSNPAQVNLIMNVPLGEGTISLQVCVAAIMTPAAQPGERHYIAKGVPEKRSDKTVEEHLTLPVGCREEVAKELIGGMLMLLKTRYLQLFHVPKEYRWYIPQRHH